jgi:exosome complex RNA-binding protein Rrp42 (RNase PH superfamily)
MQWQGTPLPDRSNDSGYKAGLETDTLLQLELLLTASKAVDLSKLVIGSGEAVWLAYLDIYVLDADGSVLDACLLAAVAALASMKSLPSVAVDDSGVRQRSLVLSKSGVFGHA